MTFVDELRVYLRRAASSLVRATPDFDLDASVPLYRKHLLSRLESLEAQLGPERIAELHEEWSAGDQLASFARELTADHLDRFGRDTSTPFIQDLVRSAIDLRLGLPVSGSLAWRLELQRATSCAWALADFRYKKFNLDAEQYALEIRVVCTGHDFQITPTAVGRVALELTGVDLVRWLLHLEAEQSLGRRDPWRLSRTTAALLVTRPRGSFQGWESNTPAWATLYRLQGMGVIDELSSEDRSPGGCEYAVHEGSIPLLKEIAEGTETPLRVLAATLLADERHAALTKAQPKLARLFGEEAAAAGIRQARLVAHEVRNSLVPVQVALEGMFHVLDRASVDGVERYRGRIDDGVDRIFKFVDETLRVLTVAAEPAEAFDVSPALSDALETFATGEADVTRTIPASGELPPILGVRSRFVLAVRNLVRNAVQSTPERKPRITVAAGMAPDASAILVTVDDDGPGVPVAHREAIFGRGFSLRPGGTGMGLALTREVVEKELGGKVSCTASSLGGARFEIVLPVTGKGAS